MRSNKITKTMQATLDKNAHMIEGFHMEDDWFGATEWSIWVELKEGYTIDGTGTIHEATVADVIAAFKRVEESAKEEEEEMIELESEIVTTELPSMVTVVISDSSTVETKTVRRDQVLGSISEDHHEAFANGLAIAVGDKWMRLSSEQNPAWNC